jgi:hypothetical protein
VKVNSWPQSAQVSVLSTFMGCDPLLWSATVSAICLGGNREERDRVGRAGL